MLNFLAAACSQVAVPEATEQAMSYYHSGNVFWILKQLWDLGIPLLFLLTSRFYEPAEGTVQARSIRTHCLAVVDHPKFSRVAERRPSLYARWSDT